MFEKVIKLFFDRINNIKTIKQFSAFTMVVLFGLLLMFLQFGKGLDGQYSVWVIFLTFVFGLLIALFGVATIFSRQFWEYLRQKKS
jgi:hypothetical protein